MLSKELVIENFAREFFGRVTIDYPPIPIFFWGILIGDKRKFQDADFDLQKEGGCEFIPYIILVPE